MSMTNQDYGKLVNEKSRPSPMGKNLVWAFLVGGAICAAGQGLTNLYQSYGLDKEQAGTATSVTLIFTAALLTGLGIFDKRGTYHRYGGQAVHGGGAGTGVWYQRQRNLRAYFVSAEDVLKQVHRLPPVDLSLSRRHPMQLIAFRVRGKPIKGRHWVSASINVCLVFPTLRLAPAWALAWGSQPPRQQMAQKVISSRIFKSSVPLV